MYWLNIKEKTHNFRWDENLGGITKNYSITYTELEEIGMVNFLKILKLKRIPYKQIASFKRQYKLL